ncbi:serine hydrolase [Streptomyces sp. NPDC050698]
MNAVPVDETSAQEPEREQARDEGQEARAETSDAVGEDTGAGAGTGEEAGAAPAVEPDTGAEPGSAEAGPETEPQQAPARETESVTAPRADAPPEPEPESGPEQDPEAEAVPAAGREVAVVADVDGSSADAPDEDEVAPSSKPEPEPEREQEKKKEHTPAPKQEQEPDPTPEPKSGPEPDPEPEPDPKRKPDPKPEPDSKPAPNPGPKPDPEPEPDPKPAPNPGPKPDPEPEPDPKPAPNPGPKPAPEPQQAHPEPAPHPICDPQKTVTLRLSEPPLAPAPEEDTTAPEPTRETPLPPLDLLARLTNTPPPTETPARTLVRRLKIWTPVFLLLAVVFTGVQALRPLPEETLDGTKTSYVLPGRFEIPWPDHGQGAVRVPGSGQVAVFGRQKPAPTASVAKIMTAYVILKEHPLKKGEEGPRITVDAKAVEEGKAKHESRIEGLKAGASFSQQDMLKMLMIPSGNNAARLLARWDGGGTSTAPFVAKMNAAAKDLGMHDTTYTDPSGLDARTVSTAVDQLKLAEAVMKFDVFRAIVAMPNATIEGLDEPLYNNNDSLLLAGLSIKGIKTGSSTPAGGTLVWAAYKTVGSRTPLILGSMMGQRVDGPDPNATRSLALVKSNSEKVVAAVRAGLQVQKVVSEGQVVGHVYDGFGRRTPVVAAEDLHVVGVPGQKLDAVLRHDGEALPRSAAAGTVVGTLTVGSGPQAPSVPVSLRGRLAEPTFTDRLTRLG